MADLAEMRNIGREMERKLRAVGIDTAEELEKQGAKQAFFRLKAAYPNVCLVHLYALEGAIQDREYNQLPEDTKKELKAFSDLLRGQARDAGKGEKAWEKGIL